MSAMYSGARSCIGNDILVRIRRRENPSSYLTEDNYQNRLEGNLDNTEDVMSVTSARE